MQTGNFVGEIGQKALIFVKGKVLMVRGVGEYGWDFPGGRLQFGEGPEEGLRRELQEELSIEDVEIVAPLYTFSLVLKHGVPRFFVLYDCRLKNDSVEFTLQKEEIQEIRWVSPQEVDALELPPQWASALEKFFKLKDN